MEDEDGGYTQAAKCPGEPSIFGVPHRCADVRRPVKATEKKRAATITSFAARCIRQTEPSPPFQTVLLILLRAKQPCQCVVHVRYRGASPHECQ
jgi:hypothetical protein